MERAAAIQRRRERLLHSGRRGVRRRGMRKSAIREGNSRASQIPHSRASPIDLPTSPKSPGAGHRPRRRCKGNMPNYWFQSETVTFEFGGRPMTIETGRLAKQAHGAALVTYGETVVLVTATHADPRPGIDFFPLTVDYVEKTSAAGKIPGGFFKREGRLSDREVLVSRFIDRSIRPLFAEGYNDETQIIATVLSADAENRPDIPAFIG